MAETARGFGSRQPASAVARGNARRKRVGFSKLTNFDNRRDRSESGRHAQDSRRPLGGGKARLASAVQHFFPNPILR